MLLFKGPQCGRFLWLVIVVYRAAMWSFCIGRCCLKGRSVVILYGQVLLFAGPQCGRFLWLTNWYGRRVCRTSCQRRFTLWNESRCGRPRRIRYGKRFIFILLSFCGHPLCLMDCIIWLCVLSPVRVSYCCIIIISRMLSLQLSAATWQLDRQRNEDEPGHHQKSSFADRIPRCDALSVPTCCITVQ